MELIYINREIVKIGEVLGLTVVDDPEFLKANVLWIESIQRLHTRGNKLHNDKKNFYAVLNIYDLNANKVRLYETAEKFSNMLLNDFFKDEDYGYEVKVQKRGEQVRKVSADTGKLYQYSFDILITTYKRSV